jgi:hypothetical protein
MATNVSTIGFTGADYTSIATWESDTTLDLVSAGDIEILEVHNDLGAITVSSTITFAGATVDASNYRVIKNADGKGWEGDTDDTSAATLACQGNYRLVVEEQYFRFDGIRFTGNGASNFCFGADGNNVMIVRCLFDGRSQTFNICELTGSRAGWQFLRCVFMDCGEYTVDTSSSGTNYCQNCTFYGCNYGPSTYGGGRLVYNNSISVGNSNNHYADSPSNWATGTDYNIMGGSDYYPSGNVIQNAVATASTSPGAGTWVMYNNITGGSEDFNIQDHASNSAKDYGKTLTGEVVVDAAGVSASGTWECGALNFYVAPGGETYEVTVSSSLSLSHNSGMQRKRNRLAVSSINLYDTFISEVTFIAVYNAVNVSSLLNVNDNLGIQRERNKSISSSIDLDTALDIYLQRSRALFSSITLTDSITRSLITTTEEILRVLSSAVVVADILEVDRQRYKKLNDNLDLTHIINVARQLVKKLIQPISIGDSIYPSREYPRFLQSNLELNDALSAEIAQFLQYAVLLHTTLEFSDGFDLETERSVYRLVQTFVPLYENLIAERKQLVEINLTDNIELFDNLVYSVRSFLTEILLHDNLVLTDQTISSIQRLLKPIGVIVYGLSKAKIKYNIRSSKIEYLLEKQKKIIYTLRNIKGRTIYH